MIFIKYSKSKPSPLNQITSYYQDVKNPDNYILIFAEKYNKSTTYCIHTLTNLVSPNMSQEDLKSVMSEMINILDSNNSYSSDEEACEAVERLLDLLGHTVIPEHLKSYT
jgi:hypothetical protein